MPFFEQSAIVALGTTIRLRITIYLDEEQTQPKDLTNAQAITWDLWSDRPHEPTRRSLIAKTLGSGISVVDAVNGVVDVQIDPVDQTNAGLQQQRYYHSVDAIDAATDTSRPTVGFLDFQA